jgi:hypothetical protein
VVIGVEDDLAVPTGEFEAVRYKLGDIGIGSLFLVPDFSLEGAALRIRSGNCSIAQGLGRKPSSSTKSPQM